jgi:tetratricopeptide (TPR) repeat protein
MTKMKLHIILIFSIFFVPAFAQQENTDIRAGNSLYEQGKFVEAEVAFRRALEINQQRLADMMDAKIELLEKQIKVEIPRLKEKIEK